MSIHSAFHQNVFHNIHSVIECDRVDFFSSFGIEARKKKKKTDDSLLYENQQKVYDTLQKKEMEKHCRVEDRSYQ